MKKGDNTITNNGIFDELVTIVVPAYNVGMYIRECLDSIVNQTYKNTEIIVVDDGSVDETSSIGKYYAKKFNNIKYIYQDNNGVSEARNNGIKHAKGKFICFVDGDDKLNQNYIRILHDCMDEEADLVCCDYIAFNEDVERKEHFFGHPMSMDSLREKKVLFLQLMNAHVGKPTDLYSTAIGVPWGKLYRLSTIKKNNLAFDRKLRRMQDNDFNMQFFYAARKIIYINSALYYYRINHISSFIMDDVGNNWYSLIKKRNEFSSKHSDILDSEYIKEMMYERYVALSSTCLFYTRKLGLKEAKKQFIRLGNDPLYRSAIYSKYVDKYSLKYKLLSLLFKTHNYNGIYLLFSLYRIARTKAKNSKFGLDIIGRSGA